VALFRQRFTNYTALEQAHLHIFADTRYDIWLDGQWLGRGPARFARNYREVDIYPLDKLPPGEHLLAVRVQWAPNLRRSESIRPLLKTYIETQNGRRIAISGDTWKSILSDV
jgi:alpha-L-rhamnosidase